jgi:hypothetical protein
MGLTATNTGALQLAMMRFRSKQTILRRYQVLGFIVWRHEELHRLTWQAYETRGQHRHEIRRVEDRRRDQGLDLNPTPFLASSHTGLGSPILRPRSTSLSSVPRGATPAFAVALEDVKRSGS